MASLLRVNSRHSSSSTYPFAYSYRVMCVGSGSKLVPSPLHLVGSVPKRMPLRSSRMFYTVTGSGVCSIIAGKPAHFEIHCKDVEGNYVPSSGKIHIEFTGPRAVYAPVVKPHARKKGLYVLYKCLDVCGAR